MLKSFPLECLRAPRTSWKNHALRLKLLVLDGKNSARSQLIEICRLLRDTYQTLPVHDSLDSIGNRPKPSEHPYPRPNPSQQEWLSLSPETFSDACLH